MIEFKDDDWILGIWFSEAKNGDNWLCCMIRNSEGTWKGIYRFRYKKDDKIFDSDDEKKWFHFTSKENQSEQQIIDTIEQAQDILSPLFVFKDRLMIRGGVGDFLEKGKTKPWMHMKEGKPEDYNEFT